MLVPQDAEDVDHGLPSFFLAGSSASDDGQEAVEGRLELRPSGERTGESEIETLRLFDYEAATDGALNTNRDLADLADGAVIIVPERGLFE